MKSAARRGRASCSAASTATSSCSARSRRCRSCATRFRRSRCASSSARRPLDWLGKKAITGLSPATVVVAFSRRAVIGLAGELNQLHPGRVACLYGAMPLASRREEIDRFIAGEAEVCAATDVLGHGVNLPCETLLFAETTKFDGKERRPLEPWEIAQIAGRAGRYGFHERGHVGVLTGLPWANPDPDLVRAALAAARPDRRRPPRLSHRRLGPSPRAALRPQRHARGRARAGARTRGGTRRCASGAATAGSRSSRFSRSCCGSTRCATRSSTRTARSRSRTSGSSCRRRSTRTGCRSSRRSPPRSPATSRSTRSSAGSSTRKRLQAASLEEAEHAAREASILRWFALQYPGVAGVTIERAAALEETAAARVVRELRAEIEDPTIGRCRVCGARTAPWASLCDQHYMQRSVIAVGAVSLTRRRSGSDLESMRRFVFASVFDSTRSLLALVIAAIAIAGDVVRRPSPVRSCRRATAAAGRLVLVLLELSDASSGGRLPVAVVIGFVGLVRPPFVATWRRTRRRPQRAASAVPAQWR